jgi:hypothetical protein
MDASHANTTMLFVWVHRDFYVREHGIPSSPRFHIYCSICVDRLALTRDHEPWPGGESRKRDCLWRVPSPLEGRFPTPPLTHSQLTHFPQRPSRDGLRHNQPFGLSPPAKSRMRPSPHTNTPASQATRMGNGKRKQFLSPTPDPCVLTPNFSCPFVSGVRPDSCPGGAASRQANCGEAVLAEANASWPCDGSTRLNREAIAATARRSWSRVSANTSLTLHK